MGAKHFDDRRAGLGRLVEYAGATGVPTECEFGVADWHVGRFGAAGAPPEPAISALLGSPLCFRPDKPLDMNDPAPRIAELPINVSGAQRVRLAAVNRTRDVLWLRVPGQDVELVSIAGHRTPGVRKDVVVLPAFTRIEFEMVAQAKPILLAHPTHGSLGMPARMV